jgi:hypothetical protein
MAMTTTDQERDDLPQQAGTPTTVGRNRRVALLIGGVLVAVALIVVVIWVAARPARTYDPGTPEGVVQEYVAAVLDRDAATAAGLLSATSSCTVADFDRATVPTGTGVELINTQVRGTTAAVRIRVGVQDAGDPFGGTSGEEYVLRLARTNATWRLDGIPWPLWICTGA